MSTDSILSLNRIDGALIEAEIVVSPYRTGDRYVCRDRMTETEFGQMDVKGGICSAGWLHAEKSHPWLWVDRIDNLTSGDRTVSGVGRALIESGIKASLRDPVYEGWVGLLAIKNAPYFYCKLGFAVLPEFDLQPRSFKAMKLYDKINRSGLTPDEQREYETMRDTFGDPMSSPEEVCLQSLTTLIKRRLRDATARLTDDVGSAYMYLPPEEIDRYRDRFGGGK